jgi:hypothetical protein
MLLNFAALEFPEACWLAHQTSFSSLGYRRMNSKRVAGPSGVEPIQVFFSSKVFSYLVICDY